MFVKSSYSGQVYCLEEMPKFGGWELSTEQAFIDYYTSKGIDPKTVYPYDRMIKN